jgi:hypothetical protein
MDEDALHGADFGGLCTAAVDAWWAERVRALPALCRAPFQRQ